MKRFIASLFALLIVVSAWANAEERIIEPRVLPGVPQSSVSLGTKTDQCVLKPLIQKLSFLGNMNNLSDHEDGEMVHATLKYPLIGEEWMCPWSIYVYNDTGIFTYYPNYGTDELEFEIPTGTYDMLSMFTKIDPDNVYGESHSYYYIVEQATINEGTVIELKPEESTNCLSMETTNPDGEKSTFRKSNSNWEIIEDGNIVDIFFFKYVLWKGNAVSMMFGNAGAVVVESGPIGRFDPQENCNFYVNDVSDNYVFREVRWMEAIPEEQGLYIAVTQCKGSVEGVYTNDPLYAHDDSKIDPTPAFQQLPPISYEDEEPQPYILSLYSVSTDDTIENGVDLLSASPYIWNVWSSGPSQVYSEQDLYFTYEKSLIDSYIPKENEWGIGVIESTTDSRYICPFNNMCIVNTVHPYYEFNSYENGLLHNKPFPGNIVYASQCDHHNVNFGGSAPLITFFTTPKYNWNTETMQNSFYYYYTGRMGEKLGSTATLSNISLSVNGNEVALNKDEAENWILNNQNVKGEYTYVISTDNCCIDGILGGNKAIIKYNTEVENSTPPVVTMLQFRDNLGNVAQTFETSANNEVLISAASYKVNLGEPNNWGDAPVWFDLSAPAKVTAWCSPNGVETEMVNEIELIEDTSEGIAHGFGALYRGSLDNINLISPNGWYDLTISVEDVAGNSQVQTLSPAFKIDKLSNINAVTTDAGVIVKGNEIIAPAGSRIYNIGGAEVGNKSLPKGIYMVVTPEKTMKVAIR